MIESRRARPTAAGILHRSLVMKPTRVVLIGVLALAGVACEPADRDMTPIPDPAGSGAPLFDDAVDPDETMGEIDDGDDADDADNGDDPDDADDGAGDDDG